MNLLRDTQNEKARVDSFFNSLYFVRSHTLWATLIENTTNTHMYIDSSDLAIFEKAFYKIKDLLSSPCTFTHKWGNHQDRIQIQSVDTYVSRDDIKQFFSGYTVSFLSCLDATLPIFHIPGSEIILKPLLKWKDVTVSDKPKLCIIAPSKAAAQQLVLSLHGSKAYSDCFLAAEHVT